MSQIDFRKSEPQTASDWAGDHLIEYVGNCPVCGTRMYTMDGKSPDPRGIVGEHAASSLDPVDYFLPRSLPTIRFCWLCLNDGKRYERATRHAEKVWGVKL